MFYFRYATIQNEGGSDISPHMLILAIPILATAVGTVLLMWVTSLLKAEPVVRMPQFSIRQILLLMAGIGFALAAWLPYVSAMPVIVQRFKESPTAFYIHEMIVLGSVGLAIPLTAKTWWGKLIAGIITGVFIYSIPNSSPFVELRNTRFWANYEAIGSLLELYMMVIAIVALNIYVASWAVHSLQPIRPMEEAEANVSEPGSN